MIRHSERGASRVKSLIGLLTVVGLLYFAAKIIPVYFANWQLQDKMKDESTYAEAYRHNPQQVLEAVMTEARGLDIPLREEQVSVQMTPQGTHIAADYTVTVDLPFYQLRLHLTPSAGHGE